MNNNNDEGGDSDDGNIGDSKLDKKNSNNSETENDKNLNKNPLNAKKMAKEVEKKNVSIANTDFYSTIILSILGGAFISLAAIFFTFITSQITLSYPFTRLLGGIVFSLGPILIVITGAELFTGNNLLVIAFVDKKITLCTLFKNWGIAYFGNFVGVLITALIFYMTDTWSSNHYEFGINALLIAANKIQLSFPEAFSLGIFSNALICLGVWMATSSKNVVNKAVSMLIPVTAYASIGFEHSIANMYFIVFAILIITLSNNLFEVNILTAVQQKLVGEYKDISSVNKINMEGMIHNLVPVTLGNIVGGSVFVGITYWSIYLKKK